MGVVQRLPVRHVRACSGFEQGRSARFCRACGFVKFLHRAAVLVYCGACGRPLRNAADDSSCAEHAPVVRK